MKIKSPLLQAGSDYKNFSNSYNTLTPAKRLPKKYRAFKYIVCSGINGVTENEILRQCRLSSGRNYVTELERRLNIRFERLNEANPDGIGNHYRYRLKCKQNATQVINHINLNLQRSGFEMLSPEAVENILRLYPEVTA